MSNLWKILVGLAAGCMLSGCGLKDPIDTVRHGSLDEWGPIAIQDQLVFWDCIDISWSVEEEHESFSTVNAVCKSASRTSFNSKVRTTVCLSAIEFRHHCLDLFDSTESIEMRFALHDDDRIVLLDASEVRLKAGKIVSESALPMSYLSNIRDHSHYLPEVSYAVLESIERNPKLVDQIWNELILGTANTKKNSHSSMNTEIARLITKRLKEVYSPSELAYLSGVYDEIDSIVE
ncbi:hypothetical protein [Limnobacter sp. MED105]|uniref:hypothetical protein n=1 Tax=Limnobacter sp. MED105 TaxID=391597 RepID=UPI000156C85E|nr:hypothetical protein [Limnobacter sp. MED105]EDM83188.1 hypothetical protein LMED105_09755 [Limnobacter sp. MED105]